MQDLHNREIALSLCDFCGRRCLHLDAREGLQDPLFSLLVQFIDRLDDCCIPQLACAMILVGRRDQQLCTFQKRDRVILLRSRDAEHHLLEATFVFCVREEQEAFRAAI